MVINYIVTIKVESLRYLQGVQQRVYHCTLCMHNFVMYFTCLRAESEAVGTVVMCWPPVTDVGACVVDAGAAC